MADHDAIARYWGRERLIEAILDALAARGVNLDALTPDTLAPVDQFPDHFTPNREPQAKVPGGGIDDFPIVSG